MIKECPVIMNNGSVSVVRFDDIDIQFPPVGKNVKTLNVKFEDGNYSIVKNAEEEKKDEPVIKEAVKEKEEIKPKKTIRKKRATVKS